MKLKTRLAIIMMGLAVGTTTFFGLTGCGKSDNQRFLEGEVKNKIVHSINEEDDFSLNADRAVFRNITKMKENPETVSVHVIADNGEHPHFIKMDFKDDAFIKFKNAEKALDYINNNFEGIEKKTEVFEATTEVLELVASLNYGEFYDFMSSVAPAFSFGGSSVGLGIGFSSTNSKGAGIINSININKPKPSDENLTFSINSTIRITQTTNQTNVTPGGDGINYTFSTNSKDYDFVRQDMITVPLTDAYRENPMLALKDYLTAVNKNDTEAIKQFGIYSRQDEMAFGEVRQTEDNDLSQVMQPGMQP